MKTNICAQIGRKALGIVVVFFVAHGCSAQHRNDNWLFAGTNLESSGRLNFTAGYPQVDTTGLYQMCEGFGTISDTQGNLLFSAASGGFPSTASLFDANLDPMSGGSFLFESASTMQGSLIVPRSGGSVLYDVFYLTSAYSSGLAQHLVVDMNLNGGFGDVVNGSTHQLADTLTEKLTGTLHANGDDYWVLMHKRNDDRFLAYALTSAGLDTVPVVSHAGSTHVHPNYTGGQMKVSNAGDKIVLCARRVSSGAVEPSIVQLFHFNDATGVVSYWLTLPGERRSGGCEISPNGCMFYECGYDSTGHFVDQYDLCAEGGGDTIAIQNSRTRVYQYTTTSFMNMPLVMMTAPDGKIYITRSGGSLVLARVNYPDVSGLGCDLVWNFLDMSPVGPLSSHCNQIKKYHDSALITGAKPLQRQPEFNIRPNPAGETTWLHFGGDAFATRVVITDAVGRVVHEAGLSTASIQPVDVSTLSTGMYEMLVYDGEVLVGQQKLVVK